MKLTKLPFRYIAFGLMIVVSLLAYSNIFHYPFEFDDLYHIIQKTRLHSFAYFGHLSTWININSRPIPMLTLAINYWLGGTDVVGYHIVNLIIHILSGVVVYFLSLQILSSDQIKNEHPIKKNKEIAALLISLLFLAHPIQTQAVTYTIQRITSLAALFYMLSVFFYLKGRMLQSSKTGSLKEALPFYAGTFISFILAILSKQIAVTLPLALLMAEFFFIRDKEGKLYKKYIITYSALSFFAIALALIVKGLPRESQEIPRDIYLFTEFKVMVKYVQLLILPINQNLDHDIAPAFSLWGLKQLFSLAFILGLISLGVYMFRRDRLISFGIFWFFLALSVESTFIPIKDFIFEHRLYLPSFGFFLILVSIAYKIPAKKLRKTPIAGILLALLVIVYTGASFARNKVWRSDLALWSDATEKSPLKARPWIWKGIAYSNLKQNNQALIALNTAIKLLPNFSMAYFNRGNVYKDMKNYDAALKDYDQAIDLKPDYDLAYFNRGFVKAKMRRYKDAIKDYNIAHKYIPDDPILFYNRGNAERSMGNYKDAISDYNKSVELDPKYALAYFNRGLSKAGLYKYEESLADFDIAIRLEPKNYLYYNGKGVSLYSLKRYEEAIGNYTTSISIHPDFGQAYYNRGFARYFGTNDFAGGCEDWSIAAQKGYKQAAGLYAKYCKK